MIDPQGKPTGVMGWWPSRAVTFLENHDTGSTQVSDLFLFLSKYDALNINIGDSVEFIPLPPSPCVRACFRYCGRCA
jgi:hypothetical protein